MDILVRLFGIASVAYVDCGDSEARSKVQFLPSAFPNAVTYVPLLYGHREASGLVAMIFRKKYCLLTITEFNPNSDDGSKLYDQIVTHKWHALSIQHINHKSVGDQHYRTISEMTVTELSLCQSGHCPGAHGWLTDRHGQLLHPLSYDTKLAAQRFYHLLPGLDPRKLPTPVQPNSKETLCHTTQVCA